MTRRVQLRRLARIVNGGTPAANPQFWGGDVQWATPVDLGIANGGAIAKTLRSITAHGLRSGSAEVPPGSLIISTRAPVGYVVETKVAIAFNQGCKGLVPSDAAHAGYLKYALQYSVLQMQAIATGSTFQELSSTALASVTLPYCPPSQQKVIADFLDRETAQIDAMIEAQGGLVDRLEERRCALTTEIVDSAAPDTRLGRLLKHHIRGVRQGWSPQCHPYPRSEDTEWAVLRTGCVNGGRFNPEDNKVLPEDLTPRQAAVVRRGEIVMSRANTRELLGSAAVVPEERPRLMLSDKLYALDTLPHANPWFITGVLGTRRLRDLIEIAATGASQSMQNISQFDIVNLPMELPARDIQDEAVTRLAVARHQIDGLASAAVDAITLMQERRSALISAAVTGRIDPRTGKETTPEKVLELE